MRIALPLLPFMLLWATLGSAHEGLSVAQRKAIDSAATGNLAAYGGPSAAIAIVRDGKIVYEQAYGNRRLTPGG